MEKISKFHSKKIGLGRKISLLVPVITATVLSFGNDLLSWHYFTEEGGSANINSIKITMVYSNIMLVAGLFLSIFLANILFRQILRQELYEPFRKLAEGIQQMRDGNLDYRIEYNENDALFEIYDDFNEMITERRRLFAKVTEVDEGRKELLLSISHDLRSPLTSIVAYVQGLLDHVASTEEMQDRYLRIIKKKAMDINEMVDRIFLFAKLDTDHYQMDSMEFSVNEYMKDIVEDMRHAYMDKSFDFDLELYGDGFIHADPDILRSICSNIVENSIKYCDKDVGKMWIKVKEGKKNIRLQFIDNGPGVPEEDLPYLWDLFYRSDKSRSNPSGGSGIGLSIVKKSVEQMRGKVMAENVEAGGLAITIRIPKMIRED